MPGRRSPRLPPEAALNQYTRAAFLGGMDGTSLAPGPVPNDGLQWKSQEQAELFFHQDSYTGGGYSRAFRLTYNPVAYSERVFLNGQYCREGQSAMWTRSSSEDGTTVLFSVPPASGARIVVEYAMYKQADPKKAFREMDLPYSFTADDDGTAMINLPFSFHDRGLGEPASVASNGVVIINNSTGYTTFRPMRIWEHGYCLAPYWMDHDSTPGEGGGNAGTTRYGVVTVDGQTALVVIWDNIAVYYSGQTADWDTRRSRFQLVLFESGVVEFNYDHIQTDFGPASHLSGMVFSRPEVRDEAAATASGMPQFSMYQAVNLSSGFTSPVVGYYLEGHMWTLPMSNKRLMERDHWGTYLFQTDPVYGEDYPTQGLSGLTDTGQYALTRQTNCGIPGRLRFELGKPGPGIVPFEVKTYTPVSAVWNGSYTTMIWEGLPAIGMVADIVGTTTAAISTSPILEVFFKRADDADSSLAGWYYVVAGSQTATYASSLPVAAGQPLISSVFMISPYGQVGGHMKAQVNINLTNPILRVHDTFEYMTA